MTASERLTLALVRLTERRQRPRCGDPETHAYWLSEDSAERDQAARWCVGCPVLAECRASAEEHGERFGVWAGADRTRQPGRPARGGGQR